MTAPSNPQIRAGLARFAVLVVALVSALVAGSPAVAAAPSPKADPQLSITVDDGRTSTKVGDALSYTVTISNLGTKKVDDLQITQTMPDGMSFRSADSAGRRKSDVITWRVDLSPGEHETLHSKAVVTTTPESLLRLATVACAKVSAKAAPVVCASHSDQLPAGAAAETVIAGADDSSGSLRTLLIVFAALAVLTTVETVVILRRRRPKNQA